MPISMIDPNLRGGWEPDVADTDTILRRFMANWTGYLEAKVLPAGGRALRRDDLAAVDLGRAVAFSNVANLMAPMFERDVHDVLGELDTFFEFSNSTKSGSVFLFSPWPTLDLRPNGWRLIKYLPLMYRPTGAEPVAIPPDLRIEHVRDLPGLRAFEQAIVNGFGYDSPESRIPGACFVPELLDDDRHQMWVGWDADRPACAASTFIANGINDVTLVATVPAARRKGYGAVVTAHASAADPALPAMLLASDDGRPVYERLGYVPLFRFSMWAQDRPRQMAPTAAG